MSANIARLATEKKYSNMFYNIKKPRPSWPGRAGFLILYYFNVKISSESLAVGF